MAALFNNRLFTLPSSLSGLRALGPADPVDGFHHRVHRLRRRELRNAVAEVEHMPVPGAWRARRTPAALPTSRSDAAPDWRTASRGPGCPAARPCRRPARGREPRFTVQSSPTASAPMSAICSSHRPPPLVKTMLGMRTPSFSRLQLAHHLAHVGEREFLVGAVGQRAAPGVEDHHGLGAGVDLRIQVGGHGSRIGAQDVVHQVGPVVQHRLDACGSRPSRRLRPYSRPASTGLPEKPISGTRPCSSVRIWVTASNT